MIAGLRAPHQTGEHNAGKGSKTDCLSAAGTRHHGEQKSPWIPRQPHGVQNIRMPDLQLEKLRLRVGRLPSK